ncbi:DUF2290 domain-containing protein [Pseudarthrobacter sp. AL07]|uniref:DUF2290 domain-containing protein n=1 Tax=unclassified Pseudarthrobacter TaxID=2647000 RepID=UPI00249C2E67|nr:MULTISPECIES: DUF2290 domain-containing protein [unclassified Pseudarthrobacter]MDI3194259.1 DUF2290 domain-containing protein [Pseudarthrobacter sp. AL20]MDI3208326.1 DUF2290 domain-containing protein [Pseudarthrobacter sp. AL07]
MNKRKSAVELLKREIEDVTAFLVGKGLVDDQNAVARRSGVNGFVLLEAGYWADAPRMQEKIPYGELYDRLKGSRAYDMKFLDGALVQFRFMFKDADTLAKSELRFLPSPILTTFQEDPELYLHDELYGDVIDARAVTVPLRFDYDDSADVVKDVLHPVSHLTLGQYPHCRIAATSAVTPYQFVEFLLRSFYRGKATLPTDGMPSARTLMPQTITEGERALLHISLPCT